MDKLLNAGKITPKIVGNLTKVLVKFHYTTPTSDRIRNFGQPKFMRKKITENFQTLGKLTQIDNKYEKKLTSFVRENSVLFYNRIAEGKICDIHGDLYLKNIFIVKNKFYLYDRIEFNDSLRYADVAEDVAHLSMDLDYHKRDDLRKYFVSQYIMKSNDNSLSALLYFLMCYKACVRAKVSLFHAKNKKSAKGVECLRESKQHLKLAESYLEYFQ